MGPPPGIAIVGTLEIEEFIGNGVGPNVYAVGSLKGDLRISFKNCLHSRQFHKQTIKHATTQSIWYDEFCQGRPSHPGRKICKVSIALSRKDVRRYDMAEPFLVNNEEEICLYQFKPLTEAYRSDHLPVRCPKKLNFTFIAALLSLKKGAGNTKGLTIPSTSYSY